MKAKAPCIVVAFDTTTDALAMERAGKKHALHGRLIPVPRQLSAGCGLAWREPAGNEAALRHAIACEGIEEEGVHTMDL